jgi:hypothetical protein
VFTLEAGALVGREGPRCQGGFGADLCAVADSEYGHAVRRSVADLVHDRGSRGHRARPKIIAVREPTGEDYTPDILGETVGVPDEFGVEIQRLQGLDGVAVAVASTELDYGYRHRSITSIS